MKYKKRNVRWMLVVYDLLVYELSAVLLLGLYGGNDKLSISGMMQQMVLALLCVFSIRLIGNVYGQIWRYGGIQCYIRLLYTDAIAFFVYLILELILPVEKNYICENAVFEQYKSLRRIGIKDDVQICI